jgi:hypothetical protein
MQASEATATMLHSWAVMLRDQAEMVMKLSASLGAHRGSAAAEAAAGKKAKRDPLAPKCVTAVLARCRWLSACTNLLQTLAVTQETHVLM